MRRITSYLSLALSAAALVCGCADNSYSGIDVEWNGDVETAIPIMAAVSNVDGGLAKGSGVVEDLNGLMDKTVGVYAARRESWIRYTDDRAVLVDNAKASLNTSDFYLQWKGQAMYYPNKSRFMESYDFFAYCIDDAQQMGYSLLDTRAVMSLKVDGSQDIMLSKAVSPTTDPKMIENLFSYYTARSNVIPIFHFKHAMSCLNFRIVPGVSAESRFKVTVQSVSVVSADRLDFVYAARDSSALGVYAAPNADQMLLPLRDEKGGPMPENTYSVVTRHSPSDPCEVVSVKGNIIAPPLKDDSSAVVVDVEEVMLDPATLLPAGKPSRSAVTVMINHPGGMKPGHRYTVSVTLSGNMAVSTSVTLSPWNDAGTIEFNKDEKPI